MSRFRAAFWPWYRERGGGERSLAAEHLGHGGIVFSFRGPSNGERARYATADWMGFWMEVDGRRPTDRLFHPWSRPFFVPFARGVYRIELLTVLGKTLWSGDVTVGDEPVVVAIWPEIRGFVERPAKVLIDGQEDASRRVT